MACFLQVHSLPVTDQPLYTRDDVLPASYRDCFGCGEENPYGVQLSDITRVGESVFATFEPKRHQQGFPNVMHGGVAATVLDEAMSYACVLITGNWCATVKT
jgi:hypothetical protein